MQPQTPGGHSLRRILTLAHLISSMIRSGRSSLQQLGQEMDLPIDLESRIKRAKRWLTNKWVDHQTHFLPYVLPILSSVAGSGELILAIDGSTIGKDCMVLMLSLIWKKRAIPLCWIVRKAPKGHFPEQMHLDVLKQFHQVIQPLFPACRIVLLGDGEFDGCQLQDFCKDARWEYVCRTAKDTLVSDQPDGEDFLKLGAIEPEEGKNYFLLNGHYMTQKAYGPVHLLYWKEPKYKDPLLLVSNIEWPDLVVKYYKKRFGIETFFSDIKSRGFHITRTKVSNPQTLAHLLIVAALAFIAAILSHIQARQSGQIPRFCRKDRINSLSLFQIGLRAIRFFDKERIDIFLDFSKCFPIFFPNISVRL